MLAKKHYRGGWTDWHYSYRFRKSL